MTDLNQLTQFEKLAKAESGQVNLKDGNLAIVMAAGHGKRIRSSLPKVAHLVWGKPSVTRVLEAVNQGLKSQNEVIVVGRKADAVINLLKSKNHRIFAFQKEQLGTGDAVRVGLKHVPENYQGHIFILPGDIGLIDGQTLSFFKNHFVKSKSGMMLLTGLFEGKPEQNYYGRVLRVPEIDSNGNLAPKEDVNRIISIVQFQDILNLNHRIPYEVTFRGKKYFFTKQELLNIKEFDSAVFAFDYSLLKKHLKQLTNTNNIQQEFYLTDLVEIFNQADLKVDSITPPNHHEVLLGFNDKTVWKTIEQVFRRRYYDRLRNLIDIEDENRFFIDEKVVRDLERMDKKGPLDISIGSGVHIGPNVSLGRKISIGTNTELMGNVVLEDGVKLDSQVKITTQENQKVVIRKNSHLAGNNVVKGSIEIKSEALIGASVNLTGSDDYPTVIGKKVTLLGSCYIFGSKIADESIVESCILIKKKIKCLREKPNTINGKPKPKSDPGQMSGGSLVIPVKFIIPPPEGFTAVEDL